MVYKVGIITASDKGYAGTRKDLSGPVIQEELARFKAFKVERTMILPDERDLLADMMRQMADDDALDLILTTGGTGFSKRDVTPEATLEVMERRAPGNTGSDAEYFFPNYSKSNALQSRGRNQR